MKPFFAQQALHFKCTSCGQCCTGGEDHYIALTHKEAERIRQHLDVSAAWFKRHYVTHHTRETLTLRLHEGTCVMLDKNGRCRIYPLRPTQCKTYPWWPEILDSRSSWNRESHHCEGINNGGVVKTGVIQAKLSQQLRAESDEQ